MGSRITACQFEDHEKFCTSVDTINSNRKRVKTNLSSPRRLWPQPLPIYENFVHVAMNTCKTIVRENHPVTTVRDPCAPHNFGRISYRERILHTAERPGHYFENFDSTIIEDWIQYVKNKGIVHVLIIMDENEFDVYDVDLKEFYRRAGLTVHYIPFNSHDSYNKIMALLHELDNRKEKVVAHCSGGKGRCGRVACAWLCEKWCLTPLEASQEFIDQAVENGLYRLGDVEKLKKWIGYGSC